MGFEPTHTAVTARGLNRLATATTYLVEKVGIEPTTYCLQSSRSPTELHPHEIDIGQRCVFTAQHLVPLALMTCRRPGRSVAQIGGGCWIRTSVQLRADLQSATFGLSVKPPKMVRDG
jgi:hypothetical protein